MKQQGLVQVYTGGGKGKSTAAIGQLVRCAGHGYKVGIVCFFKDPESFGDGEFDSLQKLGIEAFFFARKHPHFYTDISRGEVREECLKGMKCIEGLFADESWDMLVLDEISIALRDGFLEEEEVLALVDRKPRGLELVLTGRGATGGLIARADLVTEFRNVKHPYDRGVFEREGIEK